MSCNKKSFKEAGPSDVEFLEKIPGGFKKKDFLAQHTVYVNNIGLNFTILLISACRRY